MGEISYCCCSGEEEATWFCQLRLVFTIRPTRCTSEELAFVRWYSEAPATAKSEALGMTRLEWAVTGLPGHWGAQHPFYDVLPLSSIEAPVLLQVGPLCGRQAAFIHNHFF